MASRISSVGWVTVSVRRSIMVTARRICRRCP
jgi:hypothetical protein